jgi:catechol 2,3-dioxygenase-like lactoylglutathione lyase family enzyme
MAIQMTGIHHSAVLVRDPERAAVFYRDVLGMEPIPTPSTFDFPDFRKRPQWFQIGPRQQIHLQLGEPVHSPGRHMALEVADIAEARRVLEAAGVAIDEVPQIPGSLRFYTKDPDGNTIEIMQWTIDWPAADAAPVPPPAKA